MKRMLQPYGQAAIRMVVNVSVCCDTLAAL